MEEAEELRRLAGGDADAARQAFERLCDHSRPFLHAYLAQYGLTSADRREDVIQDTFLKLWAAQSRFRNHGPAAWHTLLRTTAYRCYIDALRKERAPLFSDLDSVREMGDPDHYPGIEDSRQKLSALADIALFPLASSLSPRTHRRQLLAAQLFCLERASWEEICDMLGPGPDEEPPLTRALLDDWLASPGVIRFMVYQELYLSGEELARALLELPPEDESLPLGTLLHRAETSDAKAGVWTGAEAVALIQRIAFGLSVEEIARHPACNLSRDELSALLDRLRLRYPFQTRMAALLPPLRHTLGDRAATLLGTPELWQRLAFQYGCFEGLPQRDILDRIALAAQEVSYAVTANALNMWLSGNRLRNRLLALCCRASTVRGRERSHPWLRERCEELCDCGENAVTERQEADRSER